MSQHAGRYVSTALIVALLLALGLGAWRVNTQAQQINKLLDDQSPLIFAFQNTSTTSGQRITFVVTCERKEGSDRYECRTEQTAPVVATLTPTPPTPTPQAR